MLKENENSYIASVFMDDASIGLAYCDISTGEICLTSISGPGSTENLINELVKINAREIVLDEFAYEAADAESIKPVLDVYFNTCLLYTSTETCSGTSTISTPSREG